MLSNYPLLQLAGQKAAHSALRHGVIAQNIANADTPGYLALDLEPVKIPTSSMVSTSLRATRASHLSFDEYNTSPAPNTDPKSSIVPNGNSVSLEKEMIKMAENRLEHEIALSVYKSTLGIMRTSLGRG